MGPRYDGLNRLGITSPKSSAKSKPMETPARGFLLSEKNYCTLAKKLLYSTCPKVNGRREPTMTDFDKLNNPTNHYEGYYTDLADELEEWYPDEEPTDMNYYEDESED